jgi:hypothetical protein
MFFEEEKPVRPRVFAADPKLVVNRERALEIAGVAGISGAT